MNLRAAMNIVETAYSTQRWVRWWSNSKTGQLLPVDRSFDHDAFLKQHHDLFLSDDELADALDGEDFDLGSWDGVLHKIYSEGWQAALFDDQTNTLSLRGDASSLKGIQRIARQIAKDHLFTSLALDLVGSDGITPIEGRILTDSDLKAFLARGILPKN